MIRRQHEGQNRNGMMERSVAIYSDDERHRYVLERSWPDLSSQTLPRLVAVMLNPSTATELRNDPTVIRVCDFTLAWGYRSIVVLNLFAFRATHPRDLYGQLLMQEREGPDNDQMILEWGEFAAREGHLWAAWGGSVAPLSGPRAKAVDALLGHPEWLVLGQNGDGSPKHPLYVPKETAPTRIRLCDNSPPKGKEVL